MTHNIGRMWQHFCRHKKENGAVIYCLRLNVPKVEVLKYNGSNREHHAACSILSCLMLNQSKSLTSQRWERERERLDDETLKLLSEYISTQNIPEDQHIFSIKRCQVHTIVKKYGSWLALTFIPIRSGIRLPSTLSGPDLICGVCNSCWDTATSTRRKSIYSSMTRICERGIIKIEF